MTRANRKAYPSETPLEQGLRRFAPAETGQRRVAIADFIVSLLRIGPGKSGSAG